MTGITVEKHIEANPDRVFEIASDFAGAPERISGIQQVEMLSDGPVGVGTRFRETRTLFGQQATEEMEVTEFDRPSSYTLAAENHGCRFESKITFTPSGSGTVVQMSFEATPVSLVAKAMAAAMEPMIKKVAEECGKDLDDLKAAIEKLG